MEIEQATKYVAITRRLLTDWKNYFVFLVFGLGFWIYKYDEKINELNTEIKDLKNSNKLEVEQLKDDHRKELESNNCIEQFKLWSEAIKGDVAKIKEKEISDVEMIRDRNQNIEETINLINKKK